VQVGALGRICDECARQTLKHSAITLNLFPSGGSPARLPSADRRTIDTDGSGEHRLAHAGAFAQKPPQ
jgi:hypothetical protein